MFCLFVNRCQIVCAYSFNFKPATDLENLTVKKLAFFEAK